MATYTVHVQNDDSDTLIDSFTMDLREEHVKRFCDDTLKRYADKAPNISVYATKTSLPTFVLTFHPNNCAYRCHVVGCFAATNQPLECGSNYRMSLSKKFSSVVAARRYADTEESSKAGEPRKADFKACKCTRQAS